MNLPIITSVADITDDNVSVLAEIAQNLSYQEDDVIQTIASSDILNPDIQNALEKMGDSVLNDPTIESDEQAAAFNFDGELGLLVFPESASSVESLFPKLKLWFTGLRKKVRKIFCQVVAGLQSDSGLDLKKIIQAVLVVLIPALAASAGLMPIVLSIVVSLAATLLKYGISQVCPV